MLISSHHPCDAPHPLLAGRSRACPGEASFRSPGLPRRSLFPKPGLAPAKPSDEAGLAPAKPLCEAGLAPAKPLCEAGLAPAKPLCEAGLAPAKPLSEAGLAPAKPLSEAGGSNRFSPRTPQKSTQNQTSIRLNPTQSDLIRPNGPFFYFRSHCRKPLRKFTYL